MNYTPVGKESAERYTWGKACDGWHFLRRDDLSVILEEAPPGESEIMHAHARSRQFFFVLAGSASMEIGAFGGKDREVVRFGPEEGLEVAPGVPHRFFNDGTDIVKFIVVSMPKSRGDRVPAA